jgi:hypothetical protein
MERATLLVCEVVPLVVCNQVDHCSLGQRCRLVEHEPAFLDTSSKRAHRPYCKGFPDGQQGVTLHVQLAGTRDPSQHHSVECRAHGRCHLCGREDAPTRDLENHHRAAVSHSVHTHHRHRKKDGYAFREGR